MEFHAIQALPRPRIRRAAFRPGDVVVCHNSGSRVRVESVGAKYFSGEYLGRVGEEEAPWHGRFRSNVWFVDGFERETV